MKYTIKSRKLGHEITFSIPGSSYIFVDLTAEQNKPGTLGDQICHGGDTMGSTMSYYGDSGDVFMQICKKWFRKYLHNNADYYLKNERDY